MKLRLLQILKSPQFWKTTLTLTAVFILALVLNWAILKIFGQKSEYRSEHNLVGILVLMGFFFLLKDFEISKPKLGALFISSLIPCYLGTVFSDLDITLCGIGCHRNPLFHSGLLFFLMVILIRKNQSLVLRTLVAGFGIGLSAHLLWDLFDHADVRWLPGGAIDRLWLAANGLLCLILARVLITKHLKRR